MLPSCTLQAPGHPIHGSQKARNYCVKDLWIQQMGGACAVCGLAYSPTFSIKARHNSCKFRERRSNLHVHFVGDDNSVHCLYRMARLKVPDAKDLTRQNRYLTTFAERIGPCCLLCPPCHGKQHAQRVRNFLQLTNC